MKKTIKLFSLLASIALSGLSVPALADDAAAPKVTVGGLVDTYYSYNFTNSANNVNGAGNGSLYGFPVSDDDYTLGLAELNTKITAGDASANIVLMYGQTAAALYGVDYTANWEGGLAVSSANLTITKGQWTFMFGKYMTWVGNEVVESNLNMNYSRSILFYAIPLYHTGFSVGVAPSEQFGITAYVNNGWNETSSSYSYNDKTFGLQAKITPAESNLSIILNGVFGPEPFGAVDLPTLVAEAIISYSGIKDFTLVLDSQFGNQTPKVGDAASYLGFALYGQLMLSDGWGLALRLEEVMNNGTDLLLGDGSSSGPGGIQAEYREATLTVQNQLTPNVLARLEGRFDTYLKGGVAQTAFGNGNADSQVTATGSMVFSF
ncbi:MAG TPA: outer membrane beta-barrel protein [bacterium]|nr:outer membrane beta-barrel protein [bacterium]